MSKSKKTKGCGKCQPCRNPDCGSCSQCLKMVKFHGNVEDDVLVNIFYKKIRVLIEKYFFKFYGKVE